MVDTTYNIYYRLNETPLTTTSFNHDKNYVSGNYLYAVKTMKLETVEVALTTTQVALHLPE